MRIILSLLLVIGFFKGAGAQKIDVISGHKSLQQFSLQHDNDFLFSIDRYYTAGTFLKYSRQLQGDFIFQKTDKFPIQIDVVFGQETYTPRELFEIDFDLLERPYAGYLFISGRLSKAIKSQLFALRGELGLAGKQSLAGDFQVAYHKLINEFIPTWAGEIDNSFHLNIYGQYVKDVVIPNSNLFKNFALQSTVALGTRRVYARQEAILFFGKRQIVGRSSAFGRLGKEEEFYCFVSIGGEYVLRNALIQGHPWGDDSPFTLPITNAILLVKAGATYRGLRNTYSFVYQLRTKETDREGRSQYVSLEFARRF